MKKGVRYLEEVIPVEVKAVHVLNSTKILKLVLGKILFLIFDCVFDKFICVAIITPLVRSELLDKIHFHPSSIDYEKFYKNVLPKSHLPSDFGGDLKSIKELHEDQRKIFSKMRDYFIYEEMQSNHCFDQFSAD